MILEGLQIVVLIAGGIAILGAILAIVYHRTRCPACGGTGRIEGYQTCPKCHGKGTP